MAGPPWQGSPLSRKPQKIIGNFDSPDTTQWKALDATLFCPGSTAHDRFQEWVAAGVFWEMWKAGLLEYDCLKEIDWSWLSMDGCLTKAPLGGEKDGAKPHRPGQAGRQAQP